MAEKEYGEVLYVNKKMVHKYIESIENGATGKKVDCKKDTFLAKSLSEKYMDYDAD